LHDDSREAAHDNGHRNNAFGRHRLDQAVHNFGIGLNQMRYMR
jgi:hypothetical protein